MTGRGILAIGVCLMLPRAAFAGMDDIAYCSELGSLASRYAGSGGANGQLSPGPEIKQALEDCHNGRSATGIAVLEKKLRASGITLPRR
jgi:hypothetical protein